MDKEFFENKDGCSSQTVGHEEVIKEIASKGPEATKAEIKEMLNEISGVMDFLKDRFTEIIDKHQSIGCIGALGLVTGVSFCGKPVIFIGIGTEKALDNTLKVVMTGMVSHEN
jgi:hypothetical protein